MCKEPGNHWHFVALLVAFFDVGGQAKQAQKRIINVGQRSSMFSHPKTIHPTALLHLTVAKNHTSTFLDVVLRIVVHVLPPKDDSSNSTTPSYCSQEPYQHIPGCCAENCHYVLREEDPYVPDYPFMEERRYLTSKHLDDTAQRRISQWRHRIAAMRAPLAQFDKETNIMGIVHTAV
ncbi:unnamed protein product [Strongylus vulgaris]|uniref:Uncharacterized protein n=1 Tax=Strongylus vulgaris TaxID=40348 RepID=A0A3P7JDW1_STRVU|nr:unnamed protein product [Strongylus vulgaris]